MTESKTVFIVKTMALAALVSVITTVTVIAAQRWLTGKSNGAVAGGVAGSTAALMAVQRRAKYLKEHEPKS